MVKKYMKGDEQSGHGGSGEGGSGDAEETSNGDQHSQNQKRSSSECCVRAAEHLQHVTERN